MRKINLFLAILLITALSMQCKRKGADSILQDRLKNSMLNYLQQQSSFDPAKASFEVLDVTYAEQKNLYNCEFKVRLIQPGKDTIGIMTGTVSKDFATVHRTF